jgi:hypothetical protein
MRDDQDDPTPRGDIDPFNMRDAMAETLSNPAEVPELSRDSEYFQLPSHSTLRRGRSLERIPHSLTASRNSSVSSTRTMIDVHMERANVERSRSASRPSREPASPFRESSQYHPDRQKSQNGAWGVPHALSLAETSAKNVFTTQGIVDSMAEPDSEFDGECDMERYVTLIGYLRLSVNCSKKLSIRVRAG